MTPIHNKRTREEQLPLLEETSSTARGGVHASLAKRGLVESVRI